VTDASAQAQTELVIEIDRELCYGFGDCVSSAPGVFELDDEDKAVVADPNAQPRDDLITAALDCPVNAITIRDTNTGEVFP
jgi:ferredoxin